MSSAQGNLRQLQEMRQWHGQELLYFGDHPYSDLADVSLNHSWRTGAIIWELDVSGGFVKVWEATVICVSYFICNV